MTHGPEWSTYIPVTTSTAVSLHDQLIAVGGRDSNNKPVSDIFSHYPSTKSSSATWLHQDLSVLPLSYLPDNQLMVVGSRDSDNNEMDSVEFGRVG